MKNHNDVIVEGSSFELSLEKILGKKIKDIRGYISSEFGEHTLSFKMTEILFEDDTTQSCAGEHDIAYLYGEDFDDGVLENIYKTNPSYESEDEGE